MATRMVCFLYHREKGLLCTVNIFIHSWQSLTNFKTLIVPKPFKNFSFNRALQKEHWYVFRTESVFFQEEEIVGRDGKLLALLLTRCCLENELDLGRGFDSC